jgi:hypothetical protein
MGTTRPGGQRLHVEPSQRFGRLTIVEEIRVPASGSLAGVRAAKCRCDCGSETVVLLANLFKRRPGHATRSCGCLHRERMAESAVELGRSVTHGLARDVGKHPLYGTWNSMVGRCHNPRVRSYRNYGARGIQVCDHWNPEVVGRELAVKLFVADIERWLGPRPPGMTLDRICNDHDYRLDNVRWATRLQQNRNRRTRRQPDALMQPSTRKPGRHAGGDDLQYGTLIVPVPRDGREEKTDG